MLTPTRILAEQTVPRYTSYPTAPHFTPAIKAEAYESWLAELAPDATLSLYMHVPYCAHLCHYCGCHTKIVRRRDPIDAYAERLDQEIALLAARTSARKVVHVHWGGGTPSMLGPDHLIRTVNRLQTAFDMSSVREHAIELDPREVNQPLIQALVQMGVTRASLGVQDLSPHVQQEIGRIQPFGIVADVANSLRDAGITDLNVDLMYGLPRQTDRDVHRSIGLVDTLKPQRLALFGYAHVPWFKTHQRLIDESQLPDTTQRLMQAETARETLVSLGYVPIGLDHFARPEDELAKAAIAGRLHRNFQGYTVDEADALIGLGASAIGRLPQGFVQNAPDTGGYSRAIDEQRFATVKGIAFSASDKVRARIIEELMCNFRVDIDAVASAMGAGDIRLDDEIAALAPLAKDGVLQVTDSLVTMTEMGRPFVRLAAAAFDAYLKRGQARHSLAV